MLKPNSLFTRRERPIWSEPGLAIWQRGGLPANAPDLSVKIEDDFGSGFFAGASRSTPFYLKVYSQLSNGPRLLAAQVAALIRGNNFEATFRSTKGGLAPYQAYLAVADVQKIPWKTQPEKHDLLVRIGRAFAMNKKVGGRTQQWGWEVDKIVFPQSIKHGTDVFPFEPVHAFQCLKRGHCRIHAYNIVYAGAVQKNEASLPSAKLQISLVREKEPFLSLSKSSPDHHE